MALEDRLARLVKVAFERHAEAELATDHVLHYPGTRLTDDQQEGGEWIRLHGFGFDVIPSNGDTQLQSWTFQADALARVGQASGSTHRVWDIAGAVADAFRYRTVDVLDVEEVGEPKVAELTFGQPSLDLVVQEAGEEGRDHVAVTLPATFERFA